jgi:hypothetical protein
MMIAATLPEKITLTQRALPLSAAVLIAVVTVELIRRRKLREEYALLWVLASVVLLAFAVFPRLLWLISDVIGVFYVTTMTVICFSFLSLMIIHLSLAASRSSEDNRKVAQRVALLESRLRELEGKPTESSDPDASSQAPAGEDPARKHS